MKTTAAAAACPITVAMPAPAMPISGRPNQPKIRIGSSAMFTIAPRICPYIGVFMSPFAWQTLVHMLSKNRPGASTVTILP